MDDFRARTKITTRTFHRATQTIKACILLSFFGGSPKGVFLDCPTTSSRHDIFSALCLWFHRLSLQCPSKFPITRSSCAFVDMSALRRNVTVAFSHSTGPSTYSQRSHIACFCAIIICREIVSVFVFRENDTRLGYHEFFCIELVSHVHLPWKTPSS